MKFGYARVSTTDQKLESQIENLKTAGAEKIYWNNNRAARISKAPQSASKR